MAAAGGSRSDSWQYQVLRSWIADGCRHEPGSGTVTRLDVEPREFDFHGPGEETDVRVRAVFADGTAADVAAFCEFRAKDESVAEVSDRGRVKAVRPGDTAVVVAYRGNVAAMRVYVPTVDGPASTAGAANAPAVDAARIDQGSLDRPRSPRQAPPPQHRSIRPLRPTRNSSAASPSTPSAACRRRTEVRAFLADRRADKRARKIDELLAHPLHAALWATKFCDITGCNVDTMDGPPELRRQARADVARLVPRRVAANVPYDKIARGVLLATSREGQDVPAWIDRDAELDRAARAGFASLTPTGRRSTCSGGGSRTTASFRSKRWPS